MTMSEQRPARDQRARRRWVEHRHARIAEAQGGPRWRRGLFRGTSTPTSHAPGWERRHWSSRLLHRVGDSVANSTAGIIASILVLLWTVIGVAIRFPEWWLSVLYASTASVTFVMVFVIQHTQSRQTSATQRKLDELLRATGQADNALIAIEEAPDEVLQALADLNVVDRTQATAPSAGSAGAPDGA